MKIDRNSNFELLRIFSMFLIVLHHLLYHGGAVFMENCANRYISFFLNVGGKVGVSCFVLISGYFLFNSKFKINKIFNLVLDVFTYSVPFLIIAYLSGFFDISGKDIIENIFSILFLKYWFITAYIGLYMIFPMLNKIIKNSSQCMMNLYFVILFIMLSVIPTIINNSPFGNNVILFSFLYLIGAYIRCYENQIDKMINSKWYILSSVILWLIIGSSSLVIVTVSNFVPALAKGAIFFHNQDSVFSIILSISIFMVFKNLKVGKSNIINIVASTVFGVYIIHDNQFVREVLYSKILRVQDLYYNQFFVIYIIVFDVIIFVICSLIAYIKNITIGKCINKMTIFDKVFEKINRIINEG